MLYINAVFTFMHLADAFSKVKNSALQGIHFKSVCSPWGSLTIDLRIKEHFSSVPPELRCGQMERNSKHV